jgi:hypothetical protein
LTALAILRALHEGVDMVFPEHDSAFRFDEAHASDKTAGPLPDTVTPAAINGAIMAAKMDAIVRLHKVGVRVHDLKKIYHLGGDTDKLNDLAADVKSSASDLPDIALPAPGDADFDAIKRNLIAIGEEQPSVRSPLPDIPPRLSSCIAAQHKRPIRSAPRRDRGGDRGTPEIDLQTNALTQPPEHRPCYAAGRPRRASTKTRTTRFLVHGPDDVLFGEQAARSRRGQREPTQEQGSVAPRATHVKTHQPAAI